MTLADTQRGCLVDTQMHLLARLRFQSLRPDSVHEPHRGPMKQHIRRRLRRQTEFDRDGVPLRGANTLPVVL